MNNNNQPIPTNEDEFLLYAYIGEAVCRIQMVEQALSCWLTMKLNPHVNLQQADDFLKTFQSYTLGKAIKEGEEQGVLNGDFVKELKLLLTERNWLIHKLIAENQNDLNYYEKRNNIIVSLFSRIKAISNNSEYIRRKIEDMMMDFSELNNRDVSHIRELLKL